MLKFIGKYKITLVIIAIGFSTCILFIYLFFTIFEVYNPSLDDNNIMLTPELDKLLKHLGDKYK